MTRLTLGTVLVVVAALGFFAAPASSVGTTGDIVGIVTDSTGAVVVGAKVTVTNTATGVSVSTTTGSDGGYQVLYLPPGKYRVRIEMQGFRASLHEGVLVQVAVPAHVDAQLELGPITETMLVTEAVAKVETTNIALGGTVGANLMVNLPLVNRNYTDLVFTQPGVQASSDRFGTPSVGGGRTQANNYLIEGVDNNDLPLNTPLAQPSPDSLEEFRLITNTINPEYGRNSGAVVNAVAKSGTNDLHGDLFYFYRGKGLNSNDFFNDLRGAPKPDFNRDLWGFTAGGPAYFPKIYKGHDKTFWFFSYQGVHQITPQSVRNQRVYTAAERDLNNTGFADWSASCPRSQATDPCFTTRVGTVPQNQGISIVPFADSNGVTLPAGTPYSVLWPNGRIPTSNFDSVARGILAGFPSLNIPAIPLPNGPNNTFGFDGRQPLQNYQVSVKGDHNLSGGHRLSGYYFRQTQTTTRPLPFTGSTVPGFGDNQLSIVSRASVTYTHVINSRTTNEFRAGWNRLRFITVLPNNVFNPSQIGFTGITPNNPAFASAPDIRIRQGWFEYGFSRNGPQPRVDETFQYTDNFSLLKDKHSFKFGFDIRPQKVSNPFFFAHNGIFDCQGGGTLGTTANPIGESTGVSGLDFLLGNCESYEQASPGSNFSKNIGVYIFGQDIWRLTPTVTLTYGVGWDFEQAYDLRDHNQLTFRPGQQSTVFPAGTPRNATTGPFIGAPQGLSFVGDPGVPRGTIPSRKKNFAPRIGIAWSPSSGVPLLRWVTGGAGKFSIRAGYGIYYNIVEEETQLNAFLLTFPFALDRTLARPRLANPFADRLGTSVPNPFPYTAPQPGSPVDFFSSFPQVNSVLDPNQRLPYAQNWNLTLERELPSSTILRVGYVGSKGTHLVATEELLDTGGRALFNPSTVPATDSAGRSCVGNASSPECIFLSFGDQVTTNNSFYHSLQLSAEKRYGRGLYLLAAYTLSKSLDTNSGFEDVANTPRNRARDRGLSAFDARHRLVLSYTWDIPGPKTGLLGRVIGGWGLSGITTFQRGFPVGITAGSSVCDPVVRFAFFGRWCRPNLIGPVQKTDPRATAGQRYFLTSAFARPALGDAGNSPRTFFSGPGINNWDFAVLKRINVNELRYFQLRAELFNGWNHAQFNVPSNPSGNFNSVNFGRSLSVRTIQGAQRVIQLGAKFYF